MAEQLADCLCNPNSTWQWDRECLICAHGEHNRPGKVPVAMRVEMAIVLTDEETRTMPRYTARSLLLQQKLRDLRSNYGLWHHKLEPIPHSLCPLFSLPRGRTWD